LQIGTVQVLASTAQAVEALAERLLDTDVVGSRIAR
jgi:hypothetical protein